MNIAMQVKAKIKKYLNYALYLFIFLLPWQTRLIWHEGTINGQYWEWGSLSLYGTEILLGFLFLGTIYAYWDKLSSKKYWAGLWRNYKVLWIALGVMWLATLFSSFNAILPYLTWYGLLRLSEVIVLVFLIFTISFKYLYLNLAFIISGALQTVLALSQWFLQRNIIVSKWLGLPNLEAYTPGTAVIEYIKLAVINGTSGEFWHRWLRAYGSFPHPNILGAFLLIVVLISLAVYLQRNYGWIKLVSSLVASFIFTGLLLTFSRSAWLVFLVSFVIMNLFVFLYFPKTEVEKEKKSDNVFAMMKFIAFVGMIVVAFVAVYPDHFYTRTHVETRLEEISYKDRLWQYKNAINIIPENMFFGGGMYNYSLYLPNHMVDYSLEQPGGKMEVNYSEMIKQGDDGRQVLDYQPVHNLYLLIWAELGVFAWLAFIGLLAWLLGLLLYRYKYLMKDSILLGYSLAFGALLMTALFDHYWWTIWSGVALFWLVIALLFKRYYYRRRVEVKKIVTAKTLSEDEI